MVNQVQAIQPVTQVQLTLQVEAFSMIVTPPQMQVKYPGAQFTVAMPITASKFFEPILMNQQDFFTRWQQLGTAKESIEIIRSLAPIRPPTFKQLFVSLNMGALEGIDTNVNNLAFAFIAHSKSLGKIGCLGRLEVAAAECQYRLSLRATNVDALQIIK